MKDFIEVVTNLGVSVGYSLILLYFTLSKLSRALDKIVERLEELNVKLEKRGPCS